MHSSGITYQDVERAADALVGRGEKATIARVRAEIGRGSPNTIHEHLKAWKAAQAPKTRQAATLSDSLSTALAQEIEQHASSARAEAEERALDAEQTADELAKTGTALETDIEALKAQVSVLSAENEALTQQCDDVQKTTEQLTQDLDRERTTKEALMLELAELRHQAKTQQQQLDREVQKREEAEKRYDTSDKARIAAEKAVAVSGATQQGLQNLVSDRDKQLERQREDYEQQIGYLRAQLEKAEERAQAAEKGKTQANTQVEVLSAQIATMEVREDQPHSQEDQPRLPFDGETPT